MSLRVCLLLFIPIVAGGSPEDPNWQDPTGDALIPTNDVQYGWFDSDGIDVTIGLQLWLAPVPAKSVDAASESIFMFFGSEYCDAHYVEARHANLDPYKDWTFLEGCMDGGLNGTEVVGEWKTPTQIIWSVPKTHFGDGCEVQVSDPYALSTAQLNGELQSASDRGPNTGYGRNETFDSCIWPIGSCPDWHASATSCVSYESMGRFSDVNFTIRQKCCTIWNFTGTNLTLDYHANFTWPWTLTLQNRTEFFDLKIEADAPGTVNIGWGAGPVFVSAYPRWGDVDVEMRFYEPQLVMADEQQAPWLSVAVVLAMLMLLARRN